MTQPTVYRFLGVDLTIIQIARLTGYPIHALHRRVVEEGMTVMDALTTPMPSAPKADDKQTPRYTFQGRSLTVREWSNETGIPSTVLASRIRAGWTMARTLTTKPSAPKLYTFRGRTLTLAGWAKVTGINSGTLASRLTDYGWTLERALTEPLHPRGRVSRRFRNRVIIRRIADATRSSDREVPE